jgi:hypothetical protein
MGEEGVFWEEHEELRFRPRGGVEDIFDGTDGRETDGMGFGAPMLIRFALYHSQIVELLSVVIPHACMQKRTYRRNCMA